MSEPTEQQVQAALEATMAVYEGKVFTPFDRQTCSADALRDFRFLLRKRLLEDKPPPTVDEVDGIKIMALDYLHYDRRRPQQPYGMGQF
jgi:hypothetical protein